jgi:hypothetical protein
MGLIPSLPHLRQAHDGDAGANLAISVDCDIGLASLTAVLVARLEIDLADHPPEMIVAGWHQAAEPAEQFILIVQAKQSAGKLQVTQPKSADRVFVEGVGSPALAADRFHGDYAESEIPDQFKDLPDLVVLRRQGWTAGHRDVGLTQQPPGTGDGGGMRPLAAREEAQPVVRDSRPINADVDEYAVLAHKCCDPVVHQGTVRRKIEQTRAAIRRQAASDILGHLFHEGQVEHRFTSQAVTDTQARSAAAEVIEKEIDG